MRLEVLIDDNPSDFELTAELNIFRGGDSGTTSSVGTGRFLEWLELATSSWATFPVPHPESAYWFRIRRAYSIFQ
jgi:hypothetical protein